MLEMKSDDKFRLAPNMLMQKIEELGKYWVFNIETGDHYSLNETAFWILERLAAESAQDQVIRDFLLEFAVSEKDGQTDFIEAVKGFLKEGILQRR